ncbi:hypothetical protein LZC95_43260 [Pendulispora brunnea]|uniref:Response regulatory domain-containing protein n=1 Tax=Pendulispora brunnea TaxID=2905690 RepID=A0ABZ2K824_9BACT
MVADDPSRLDRLSRGLRREGFDIARCGGPIGLTRLIRSFHPDIVLVDIRIPCDNSRIVELIRSVAGPNAKCFVLSDSFQWEAAAPLVGDHAHGRLTKDLSMHDMAAALKATLGCGLPHSQPQRLVRR